MMVIESGAMNHFIMNILSSELVADAYIGLTDINDEDQFTWDDGSYLMPSDYMNWAAHRPSSVDPADDCVSISSHSGYWTDRNCAHALPFVCFKPDTPATTPPNCGGQTCHENAVCQDNQCVCNDGYQGDGVTTCNDVCVCRVRGDPLVETYDGQWLMLIGTAKYTLTKHMDPNDKCSFNVEVKVGGPNPQTHQTYADFIEVMVDGVLIRVSQDGVYVGNNKIVLPDTHLAQGLQVYESGRYIIIESSCGIRIGFDPEGVRSVVTIMVPVHYSDKMIGVCGDCDGNLDEYTLRNGQDVSDKADKFRLISQSYEVDQSNNNMGGGA